MTKTKTKETKYKDTVFRLLFGEDKDSLLSLYNALNHTDYDDPEMLEINTLEGAIYMGVWNDVSFILSDMLCLYEHQSTVNPNMPLRDLFYVSDILKAYVKDANIYSRRLVHIPFPKFVVFYNGLERQKEKYTYRLSDAFLIKNESPMLELVVDVNNINPNYNEDIKCACTKLGEYTKFIETVRRYQKDNETGKSLKMAIDECIANNILKDFLLEHGKEIAMYDVLYDYDPERHMRMEREEWREIGRREIIENALKKGSTPEMIVNVLDISMEEVLKVQNNMLQEV